jgi:predicted aminopeptidase
MRFAAVVVLAVLLGGCESLSFYVQAIGGHLGVIRAARPVDTWIADPATPAELRERLELAKRVRDFATRELGLPANGSYGSYADLRRPYVAWNVYAAPAFSVEARQECFPIAGCVAYRGFFSEAEARRHAARLRAAGYDVHIGGVPAYSTLGWMDDPLLSTFIAYPDAQLARLLFHELAHQVAYARHDTTFNESFAVAVEEEGVRRWLLSEGRLADLEDFRARQLRKREFAAAVETTRKRLAVLYASGRSEAELLEGKRAEFARLRAAFGPAVPTEPNNAFLVSISVYTQLVPGFERLLAETGGHMPAFYERVRSLATQDKSARQIALR